MLKKTISKETAKEVALHFHKKEKAGRLRREEVFTTRDAKNRLHVEVIVDNNLVVISTFFGSPTVDGSNINDAVSYTPKEFYKSYRLLK